MLASYLLFTQEPRQQTEALILASSTSRSLLLPLEESKLKSPTTKLIFILLISQECAWVIQPTDFNRK